MHRKALILGIVFGFVCAGTLGIIATKGDTSEALAESAETLIFFTRHGEDQCL